ncbi:MAG: hypothetical protein U9P72_02085 [Campylobacterota bacterium]|nr:hypothetical protein [Campylobacterota bacterium]
MLDMNYYLQLLDDENKKIVNSYFGLKKFKSISSAQYFFKEIVTSQLDWIEKIERKQSIIKSCKKFAELLNDEQFDFDTKKKMVLEKLDKDSPQLAFLDAKGTRSVTIVCPKCKGFGANSSGKAERGWIPAQGTAKAVICQHRTSCGFNGDFIAAFAEEYNKSYGEALNLLADDLGIDFTINEVHIDSTKEKKVSNKPLLVPKKIEVPTVNYMEFDKTIPYRELDWTKYTDKYEDMTEVQQFKMIATAIYDFSRNTKQWQKINYFKSIGISAKIEPILLEKVQMIDSKVGCLFKTDIPDLLKYLQKFFPLEDLLKYGVLNNVDSKFPYTFKQSVEEALIVIPNFDLYTNMVTGLKYRKTQLKEWTDKEGKYHQDTNKEPEFSYGRIAQPLPYHLTREALLNKSINFRFFEGQKDLHSMPSKNEFCDIAIPGINGINEEMLGLFKGRIVELYFDQDKAGQIGASKLKILLEQAGAIVTIITWDANLGGDVNEVLQNENIKEIL